MKTLALNDIALILLTCTFLLFIAQLIYYTALYNRIYRHNKAAEKDNREFSNELPPLSVIIYAKDELKHLQEYLPAILEQDYPEFEVIVINDSPTDGSDDYLTRLEEKHSNLYHSFTPDSSRYISHKKLGITLGIKASKYDWLVFTEPGCRPASANWLRLLARNFTKNTEIVLGHNGYEKGKGWFGKKVSFDSLFIGMRTLGFVLAGKPYTGCGRNMAYKKELFYTSKGFSSQLNLNRGDDDIFINKVAKKTNTRVETSADAVVWIKSPEYKNDWKESKLNGLVTAAFHSGSQRYLLGFETFTRLLFYAVVLGSIVYGILQANWVVIAFPILLWLIRFAIQMVIINKTARSLGDTQKYYFSLLVLDIQRPMETLVLKLKLWVRGKADFMRK